MFQSRESQFPFLKNDAVNGVDFFAHACARILGQVNRSGIEDGDRFKHGGFSLAKALLQTARRCSSDRHQVDVHIIAPGNTGDMEVLISRRLQGVKLVVVGFGRGRGRESAEYWRPCNPHGHGGGDAGDPRRA